MTATTAQVVAQVRDFIDHPDLDTIRPVNQDSHLYLSWDPHHTNRPRLAPTVQVPEDVLTEAARDLANLDPAQAVVEVDADLSVWLVGDQYTGLLAERALRCAEEWHDNGHWTRASRALADYLVAGGDLHAARYLALDELVTANLAAGRSQ